MKRIIFNKYLHLLIAIIAFALMWFLPDFFYKKEINLSEFQAKIHHKEEIATTALDEIMTNKNVNFLFANSEEYVKLEQTKGISFFIIEKGKRTFWTSRDVQFDNTLKDFTGKRGLVQLKNGWYQYLLKKQNQKHYLALILVKNEAPINNRYFNYSFHHSFKVAEHSILFNEETENAIYDLSNNFLFSIQLGEQMDDTPQNNWLILVLFLIAWVSFLSFLSKQLKVFIRYRKWSSLIVVVVIVLIRLLLLKYNIFYSVFNLELFSPTVFAQSAFLPSLGDLLLHAITCLLILYYYVKFIRLIQSTNKTLAILLSVISSLIPLLLSGLIQGLIVNSNINFDVNYLLDLNVYSFIGIASIVLLLIATIIFIKTNISHFIDKAFKRNHIIIIYWVFSLLFVIIGHFFFELSVFLTGWVLFAIVVFSFKTTPKVSFYRSAFLIFIIALTISYGFIHLSKQKEQVNKEFLVKKIAKERDPVAEYLFEEIEERIKNDNFLITHIANYWGKKDEINKHLLDKYFGGYWTKYDVNVIYPCTDIDSIFVEDENREVNCLSFFNNKIERESNNPFGINKSINFLYSDEGISSYLAKLKIKSNTIDYYLFIELFPKIFSKAEGYPELLLDDKNTATQINTNQYSYAKYKKGNLIDKVGAFNYSVELNTSFKLNSDGFASATFNNAYHVIYQSDKNTTIVLTTPQKTMFNYITTFSYFFIISSLLVLLVGFFFKISPFNWQIGLSNFSTKIQLFVIVSIFLSFILFGWATTYYIKKQNFEKNQTLLQEKVQSVLVELEHKLGGKQELNTTMYDEMTYYLVKFSNVFFTDINLYDKSGKLLASSRPEVFDKGLIGSQMDTEAYKAMRLAKKSHYTHNENIGQLNYLSTYVPFRNNQNKILAYMNLPYFAKQHELDNELSSFYTALVNVYGLLFLISAIIAVFFANYISEPVRLIKDKLSALQLGKSSELLEWQSNDEIGALVLEYNKKVLELEKSAQLLVQSERESAWREMAKQVAHEIKNPLTPMKLSIQQLQRVASDDAVDLSERIERTSKTLIDQIDTLTRIANEFSNFAKMPKANEQKLNLIAVIETVLDLYKEENVVLELVNNSGADLEIIMDKDQLLRVFTNLIKNAIQAIPENIEGKIVVVVGVEDDDVVIEVKDNGTGIPEDKKDKIFVPNFTTKTTGMGLGLAMVKNIVETASGKIWFETKEDVGTSFYISLPKTLS